MVWNLRVPEDLVRWRVHCKLIHGTWFAPSTPLEEYWEFHELDHKDPGDGMIPHQHGQPEPAAVTDHGFW